MEREKNPFEAHFSRNVFGNSPEEIKETVEMLMPRGDLTKLSSEELGERYLWLQNQCERSILHRNLDEYLANSEWPAIDRKVDVPVHAVLLPGLAVQSYLDAARGTNQAEGYKKQSEQEAARVVLMFELLHYFQTELDNRGIKLPTMEERKKTV